MIYRSTTIIAIVGLTLFIVGACVLGIFFYVVEKEKVAYELQTLEQAKREAYYKTLETLTRTLEETENERTSLSSRVLKEENVVEFLALIESIGREQGVVLSTDSLVVEPVDEIFESLVVQVSVEGSYDAVMHVLTIFEHLPYKSSIHGVSLDKSVNNIWRSSYSIRVIQFKKI